jgi:hypothetical protein
MGVKLVSGARWMVLFVGLIFLAQRHPQTGSAMMRERSPSLIPVHGHGYRVRNRSIRVAACRLTIPASAPDYSIPSNQSIEFLSIGVAFALRRGRTANEWS